MKEFLVKFIADLIQLGKDYGGWLGSLVQKCWNNFGHLYEVDPDFQYGTNIIVLNILAGWVGVYVGKAIGKSKDDLKDVFGKKNKKPPKKPSSKNDIISKGS